VSATPAERFGVLLTDADYRLRDVRALADVRTLLADQAAALPCRLRVAVVGRICQGKSTLVNALIGKRLTPTGALELSYSVNHIRYGPAPSLTVRFKDGTSRRAALADLEEYAARRDDNRKLLASIAFLEVVSDQPYLAGFDLIDTAGLDSIYGEDSDGTLEFLRRSRREVRAETVAASTEADALIVVMSSRGMADTDEEMLRTFLGPESHRSPVTTTGVMTKVESYWPASKSPFDAADQHIKTMLGKADVRQALFEIQPVCGKLAETAAGLDEADFADLQELAGDIKLLEESVQSANVFARDRELPLEPSRRAQLHTDLTGYGLWVACEMLHRQEAQSLAELRERLDVHSGMAALRTRLTGHFAHRADLIKVRMTADSLGREKDRLRRHLGDRDMRRIMEVVSLVEDFARNEHGLSELDLLQRIAAGEVTLGGEDRHEVLHAIGEYGRSVQQRLNLPDETPLCDLRDRADQLARRWRQRRDVGFPGGDPPAARVIADRYELLLDDIDQARAHLEYPR
jgi:hypothetical protein